MGSARSRDRLPIALQVASSALQVATVTGDFLHTLALYPGTIPREFPEISARRLGESNAWADSGVCVGSRIWEGLVS